MFDRRSFCSAITGVTAVAWLSRQAAGSQVRDAADGYTNAVSFVQDPADAGVSTEMLQGLFAVRPEASSADQEMTFPQSIASGDPAVNGIVLWTRVEPGVSVLFPQPSVGWQIAGTPISPTRRSFPAWH